MAVVLLKLRRDDFLFILDPWDAAALRTDQLMAFRVEIHAANDSSINILIAGLGASRATGNCPPAQSSLDHLRRLVARRLLPLRPHLAASPRETNLSLRGMTNFA
jgi:hypothetical protein